MRKILVVEDEDAIREVIAFPKTAKAADIMADSPSEVSREQLSEVGVKLSPLAEKHLADLKT